MWKKALIFLSLTAAALYLGWLVARPNEPTTPSLNTATVGAKQPLSTGASPDSQRSSGTTTKAAPTGGWVPPEGDPVTKYKAGKTKEERYDTIANFMALGHDKNPFMLVEALRDPDLSNRMFAVESASALPVEQATHVLRQAALNDQLDVREMGWSLLAPFPDENRNEVFAEVIANGNDTSLTEVLTEMERQPDIIMFDTMVSLSAKADPARKERLLKAMQEWLVPGGGDVPQFKSTDEATAWWIKNRTHYDEYILRLDQ